MIPATASPWPKAVAATSVWSVALIVPSALRATTNSGKPKRGGQVAVVLGFAQRRHQPAGALDQDDFRPLPPIVDAAAQQGGIDSFSFPRGGQVRGQRGLEALRADVLQFARPAGGVPQRQGVVGNQVRRRRRRPWQPLAAGL